MPLRAWPLGLARLDGTLHGRSTTSDHYLTRRVEVDRTDHLTLCGFGACGQYIGVFEAKDRCHTALAGRHRLLHQLPAQLDQLDCIGERQATGSYQRRILAEAMPGNEGRSRTTLCLPQAPERDRGCKNSRLGLVGLIELLFRPLLSQRPEVITQRSGRFGEGVDDDVLLSTKLGQHAERLRTLTGKDESE